MLSVGYQAAKFRASTEGFLQTNSYFMLPYKILTLVNAVLWPFSQPELFLLALAEHNLILPSASGSLSSSMGE